MRLFFISYIKRCSAIIYSKVYSTQLNFKLAQKLVFLICIRLQNVNHIHYSYMVDNEYDIYLISYLKNIYDEEKINKISEIK